MTHILVKKNYIAFKKIVCIYLQQCCHFCSSFFPHCISAIAHSWQCISEWQFCNHTWCEWNNSSVNIAGQAFKWIVLPLLLVVFTAFVPVTGFNNNNKRSENRNCTGFGFAYLSCSELVLHIPSSRQEAKLVISNSTSARCMCRHIHETTVSGIGYILFIYSVWKRYCWDLQVSFVGILYVEGLCSNM